MGRRKIVAICSLFAVLSAAPLVDAEEKPLTGEVELGLLWLSSDRVRFSDYTGAAGKGSKGFYLIGDVNLSKEFKSGDRLYVYGEDLGFFSRYVEAGITRQGSYKVYGGYSGMWRLLTKGAETPFAGHGGNTLTLPSNWVAGANATAMPQLGPSLHSVEFSLEREKYMAGFSVIPAEAWNFKLDAESEFKKGTKPIGLVVGSGGGNPRAIIGSEPVDYRTDQMNSVLEFANKKVQMQFGYYLSLFNNSNDYLRWQNPYTREGTWALGTGYPAYAQLALPPDNQFHQISLSGGYNFSPTTRLAGNFAYGRMMQDDRFLPYTFNPTLAAAMTHSLPRTSLDGKIDTRLVNLKFTSRPMPKLNFVASYRYYETANKTPRSEYVYVAGDSINQPATVGADGVRWRLNAPLNYAQHQFKLDGSYVVAKRTTLSLGYDYDQIRREYTEVARTFENTFRGKLRSAVREWLEGSIDYSYSMRRAPKYNATAPFNEGYDQGYTGSLPANVRFDNHPFMRKFYQTDRDRNKAGVTINLMPMDALNIGLNYNYYNDRYQQSYFGLTDSTGNTVSVDVSMVFRNNIRPHIFYTYEEYDSTQKGRSYSGAPPATKLAQAYDPNRDWRAYNKDRVDTIGVGLGLTLIKDRLDFSADYSYSMASTDVSVGTGPAIVPGALPFSRIRTTFQVVTAKLTHKLSERISLKYGYRYEDYRSKDWAYDNLSVGSASTGNTGVILLGNEAPDYRIHIGMVSLIYKF